MAVPAEDDLVFNIVWTGTVFTYLRYFTLSLLAHSRAQFRFVANGCPPDQLALMEAFRAAHRDRVVDVLRVSDDMIAHGVALERVRALCDDGDHFCLIDPDIKANAPFVEDLAVSLGDHAAITSGTEVWTDDNLVPIGHVGVAGEHFFDRKGFVFGSPHLALYCADTLAEVEERWGIGLGSAGPELTPAAKERLAELGHEYLVYDTAKIVNALMQADGYSLVHRDLPQLVHIGGLAHYLSPPGFRTNERGEQEPDWTVWDSMVVRHQVTRFTAQTLRALVDGEDAPAMPDGLGPASRKRLELVRDEVVDLVDQYGEFVGSR